MTKHVLIRSVDKHKQGLSKLEEDDLQVKRCSEITKAIINILKVLL